MSLLLRSLIRDTRRPVTRLVRRLEDDIFDDWPARKVRRTHPAYEPVNVMEDMMARQMANTWNRVQEFVDDMEAFDGWANRMDTRLGRRTEPEAQVRRTESGNLQLAIDMADYRPEDLKIKLVDDNLVVEAESESSGKDSYRKSHFKRWFRLPDDVKLDDIKSKLTDSNKLLIDLPLNKPLEKGHRTIPIEMEAKKVTGNEGSVHQKQDNREVDEDQARQSAARN